MPDEPTPNYTLAAIKAQAEEILRVAGRAERSQEAEVLMMASVGRAGVALANLVQHWFRQQEWEAKTALMRPHVLVLDPAKVQFPDWLLERLKVAEPDTAPKPPADVSWLELDKERPDA